MQIEDGFLTELSDDTFEYLDKLGSQTTSSKSATQAIKTSGSDLGFEEEEEEEGGHEGNDSIDGIESSQDSIEEPDIEELTVIANQWKSTGRLPEDFVIDDKLTEEKLDKALYDFKVSKMLDEKIAQHIKERGLSDEDVANLKGQKLGVDISLYNKVKAYTELSKITFEDYDDDNVDDVREFLTVYYKDLQMPEKKIQSSVDADLKSEDLDDTMKEAQTHFSKRSKEFSKKIEDIENAKIKEQQDKQETVLNKEKAMLQSRNIGGYKITEEQAQFLSKALHEKDQVIKLADGRSVRTTLYHKKIYEASSNPEQAFLQKVKFLLDDSPGDSPKEAASKGFLKDLGEIVKQKGGFVKSKGNILMQEI